MKVHYYLVLRGLECGLTHRYGRAPLIKIDDELHEITDEFLTNLEFVGSKDDANVTFRVASAHKNVGLFKKLLDDALVTIDSKKWVSENCTNKEYLKLLYDEK
jgi:hypothetical protein